MVGFYQPLYIRLCTNLPLNQYFLLNLEVCDLQTGLVVIILIKDCRLIFDNGECIGGRQQVHGVGNQFITTSSLGFVGQKIMLATPNNG